MATKKQQTFAKMNRERAVRERRARKILKNEGGAAARKAVAEGSTPPADAEDTN